MHEGKLVFAQLMDFLPKRDFDACVKRYRGNYRMKEFSCRDQFLAMAFAQLTYRESLRDIETCLSALQGSKTAHLYPTPLRRIAFYDEEHQRRLVFLTNNFDLPALTIAQLYRCRWRVELFFKWIKQNLRIKVFYGNSVNAVKTQVWIAISVFVLVAILKRELRVDRSLTAILQILSVTPFEKTPIFQALATLSAPNSENPCSNQLALFDL